MGETPTPAILPDKMPEAWVDQLKNVVRAEKPKLWIILLGSSLLASIITSAFSLVTAVKNIKASQRLEQTKAQLELQKETFRTRTAAYLSLEKDLNVLDLKLQSLSSLVEIAYRYPRGSATSKTIREQVNSAGLVLRDVITERRAATFLQSEIGKEMDASVREVTLALSSARADPQKASPRVESARALVEQLIPKLQAERDAELNKVH